MYLDFAGMIFFLFFAFITQIVIHELGHLFFGLMSGYKFISLRLFGFTIVKLQNKLVYRTYNLKDSLGQCLMYPPEKDNYKYKLITLGGIIMNTLTASITVLFMIYNQVGNISCFIGLVLFAFYGYGMALISILPNTQLSDGTFLKELNDRSARNYNRIQLLIAIKLMEGYTYKQLPKEMYVVPEGKKLNNSIIAYHKVLESYYYMDCKKWDKAKAVLVAFDKLIETVPKSIRHIVAAEKLFLALIENKIPFVENRELEQYLNGTGDIHFQRVKTARYINRHHNDKERYIKLFLNSSKKYACQGEVVFCQRLLEEIP